MENDKVKQLKDILEREVETQTDYILDKGITSDDNYDSLVVLNSCLNSLASISTIEAEEKSKLAYDVILNQTKNIDFSNIDMNSMKDMFNNFNKNI